MQLRVMTVKNNRNCFKISVNFRAVVTITVKNQSENGQNLKCECLFYFNNDMLLMMSQSVFVGTHVATHLITFIF